MEEVVVFITAGSEDEARNIANGLVEKKLAACVNLISGVTSIFQWKGKITEEREWLLLVKTVNGNFDQVAGFVKSIHSYSVPEIIALPIRYGTQEYLSWIHSETQN